jgi:hypothetical protein
MHLPFSKPETPAYSLLPASRSLLPALSVGWFATRSKRDRHKVEFALRFDTPQWNGKNDGLAKYLPSPIAEEGPGGEGVSEFGFPRRPCPIDMGSERV